MFIVISHVDYDFVNEYDVTFKIRTIINTDHIVSIEPHNNNFILKMSVGSNYLLRKLDLDELVMSLGLEGKPLTKQVLEASKLDGVQWVTLTPDEIAEQFPSW